jgi:hypothetical protein
LHRLGTERLPVEGRHGTVDAWAVRLANTLTVLVTNHTLPRQLIMKQLVRIEVADTPTPANVYLERIDDDHANAKRVRTWMVQMSLANERAVLEKLREASRMIPEPATYTYEDGRVWAEFDLPPHAVAALTIDFGP